MGKIIRALFMASAATAVAYVVVAAARRTAGDKERLEAEPARSVEIDAEELPAEVRDGLVAELEGHV